MRLDKASQEASQQIVVRKKYKNSQPDQSQQNYIDDEDPVNCPLIFKAILLTLITIGILAFIITFATQVQNSSELYTSDFIGCADSSNVRRLSKYYAYEKMILGLSISGLVFAFGLTVFLIKHAYDFCRCCDDCYDNVPDEEQSQSEVDMQTYQIELKKRIKSNVAVPKNQIDTTQIILPKKQAKQKQQEPKIKVRNPHIRKYLKSPEQIRKIDKQYKEKGGNSDQIQCDCQCDDIGSCLACCVGCLWCRTCFEAHHYRFYKTKNQEYAYWVFYMVKTLFFGTALAYVIRIYVSIRELDYCQTVNAKQYADALNTAMVIGIITACLDVFGYIHLLIEGSLLQLVEDTLREQAKSQHSEESESDGESTPDNKKKKAKKYMEPSSDNEDQKPKKSKKMKKQSKQSQKKQSSQSQQLPTKLNLLSSIKKQSSKTKLQPEQKPLPSAKDTDSFFIKLKTLGNKYMDDIGNQEDNESQQSDKNKKKKTKRQSNESQQSYQSSNNNKPDIFVPIDLDKLPRFQNKKAVMVREEESVKDEPFWKNQLQKKTQGVGMFSKQKDSQKANQQMKFKRQEQKRIPNGPTKFGAFNRGPAPNNTFNKEPPKTETSQKDKSLTHFQKLSKLSTKF